MSAVGERAGRALPGARPVEPLLQVLATAGVHELLSREPSLEELFLAHYGASSRTTRGLAHAG